MNNNYLTAAKNILETHRHINAELDSRALLTMLTSSDFKAVYDDNSKLLAEYASIRFSGLDPTLVGDSIAANNAKLESIAAANGIVLHHYHCSLCNDSGYDSNGDYCTCISKLYIDQLRKSVMSSGDMLDFTFDKSAISKDCKQATTLPQIYSTFIKYCDSFPNNNKKCLIISGQTGVGKSCLMSAIANRLVDRSIDIMYFNAFNLNNMLMRHHTGKLDDDGAFINNIVNCDALFIDDLGTEPPYNNVTINYLYMIIERRRNKHTIISTNFSSDDILARYGDRIFSRLTDKNHCIAIAIDGDNLRNLS